MSAPRVDNRLSLAGLAALAGLLLLPACGRDADATRERHEQGQPATADAPADPTADMVSAVSASEGKAPVALKFRVSALPRVGVPLDVEMALVPEPKLELTKVTVALSPREGLQLHGNAFAEFTGAATAQLQWVTVTVVPQQNGVLALSVTILVVTEQGSTARSYTVPLIVPSGSLADAEPPAARPGTSASRR